MKVLFQTRKNIFNDPGGDTIQILKTKEYLENKGVNIDISTELEPDLTDYDIVHFFNIIRPQEVYIQLLNAKRNNKKTVLSTIYVNYWEYEKNARPGLLGIILRNTNSNFVETLKIIGRALKKLEFHKGIIKIISGYNNVMLKIMKNIDIFLPNSLSEIRRLQKDLNFKITKNKIIVVPNAFDKKIFNFEENSDNENLELDIKDFVLCVARIEGRKNQLNLVKAINELPYNLILIGKYSPNHKKYYEKVKEISQKKVLFIEKIDHENLKKYYRAAKVHVLPSWFETTGLSSLEAAAMGTNIVITRKGDTEEYFKNYGFYCEPDNVESIKNAIIRAYEEPFDEKFREYILKNYTWEKTAEKTLEAYNYLLENK